MSVSVSKIHAPLVQYLVQKNCDSVRSIVHAIKISKDRRHKRYDAIAYLARELIGLKSVPLTLHDQTRCKFIFRGIMDVYARERGKFPAYAWIIEKCLLMLGRPDLIQFLHCLKCPSRRRYYETVYGPVFSQCAASARASAAYR